MNITPLHFKPLIITFVNVLLPVATLLFPLICFAKNESFTIRPLEHREITVESTLLNTFNVQNLTGDIEVIEYDGEKILLSIDNTTPSFAQFQMIKIIDRLYLQV